MMFFTTVQLKFYDKLFCQEQCLSERCSLLAHFHLGFVGVALALMHLGDVAAKRSWVRARPPTVLALKLLFFRDDGLLGLIRF